MCVYVGEGEGGKTLYIGWEKRLYKKVGQLTPDIETFAVYDGKGKGIGKKKKH